VPSLWLCLWPSPAPGRPTLTSHALLAQASLERMTSVGCRHPHRIFVFTVSDGANPFISATAIQLTPKLYYNSTLRVAAAQ